MGWGNAVSFLEKRDMVYERPVTSGKLLAPKFANDSKRDPDNFVFERELSSGVSQCVYFNEMIRYRVFLFRIELSRVSLTNVQFGGWWE